MTDGFSQFLPLLNALSQPAVWLEGRRVVWRSAAAAGLGVEEGGFFPELPESFDAPGRYPVTLAGKPWDAVVQPFEDGALVFLEKEESDDVGTLRALARGLHPIVCSAVAAGAELFPKIEDLEDEAMQAAAARLSKDCFRLLRTVGALDQYSRLLREPERGDRRQTDLLQLLRELAAKAGDILLDAGIRLETSIPQGSVNACVDAAAIRKAVLCLLSNAAKYCGADRTVCLTVTRQERKLLIRVSDHGAGIPPEILANAFSQYRQDGDASDERRGLGLGLALAKAVAQQHDGNILITNTDGADVTMTVSLELPEAVSLREPVTGLADSYDPALVEFSCLLPSDTFDSRSVDL